MPDESALNGDMSRRVFVSTRKMRWEGSPGKKVWRKRLHRVGPLESGQVTSLVRYDPRSSFPPHGHPDGEEILVLDGVFSDQQGDFPAGSYLLNPEGFRHEPGSVPGCLLFVKLRQYAGRDRLHVALDTDRVPWGRETEGVSHKRLYRSDSYPERMDLIRLAPEATLSEQSYPQGVEWFVISGDMKDEGGRYRRGDWLRLPPGSTQNLQSENGCAAYRKTGAVSSLATEAH